MEIERSKLFKVYLDIDWKGLDVLSNREKSEDDS